MFVVRIVLRAKASLLFFILVVFVVLKLNDPVLLLSLAASTTDEGAPGAK